MGRKYKTRGKKMNIVALSMNKLSLISPILIVGLFSVTTFAQKEKVPAPCLDQLRFEHEAKKNPKTFGIYTHLIEMATNNLKCDRIETDDWTNKLLDCGKVVLEFTVRNQNCSVKKIKMQDSRSVAFN